MFVLRGKKMKNVVISFPDGSEDEFEKGITGYDLAKTISQSLANNALAIKLNDTLEDLNTKIKTDSTIQIITFDDKEGKEILRHSTSHILAAAIKKLYPKAKFAIGPAIEDGFYYDFDDLSISTEDFPKIESEMKKLINEKLEFKKKVITSDEALVLFKNEPYKIELIRDLKAAETVSIYTINGFTDQIGRAHV